MQGKRTKVRNFGSEERKQKQKSLLTSKNRKQKKKRLRNKRPGETSSDRRLKATTRLAPF